MKVLAYLSLTRLFVRTAILLAGFYFFGVMGFLWALLVSIIIYVMMSLVTQRYFNLVSFTKLTSLCWRSVTSTGFMYFFLKAVQQYLYASVSLNVFAMTGIIVVAGIISYSLCVLALWSITGKPDGPENEVLAFIKNR